jgi:hypothetical protein
MRARIDEHCALASLTLIASSLPRRCALPPHVRRFLLLAGGVAIRLLASYALHSLDLHSAASSRLELTSAAVSFRGVRESLALLQHAQAASLAGDGGGVSIAAAYAGASCSRAPPLVIAFFDAFISVPQNAAETPAGAEFFFSTPHIVLLLGFIILDLVTGVLLYRVIRTQHTFFPPSCIAAPILASQAQSSTIRNAPGIMLVLYLYNPLTIISCVLFNLGHFSTLIMVAMMLAALRGRALTAVILLAVATYLDMYPILIVLPLLLLLHKSKYHKQTTVYAQYEQNRFIQHDKCRFIEESSSESTLAGTQSESDSEDAKEQAILARMRALRGDLAPTRILKVAYQPVWMSLEDCDDADMPEDISLGTAPPSPAKWNVMFFLVHIVIYISVLWTLMYASYLACGSSWSFLASTYGYTLSLQSLSPTYGLFWYFFTVIFSRFHTFFLAVFHGHLLGYLMPLTLRFGANEPAFMLACVMQMVSTLKAYPTLPEISVAASMCLLMNLPLLLPGLRRIYPLLFGSALSLVTLALMQRLWLTTQSGNANFFYFQNLLFVFTQLFALMEGIGAVRRTQAKVVEGRREETRERRRKYRIAATHARAAAEQCETSEAQKTD